MSASAINLEGRGLATETADSCKIVVFYEDNVARVGAMSVCERLANQFAEDLDFEFKWCKTARLADPMMARQATAVAEAADIVMFCPQDFEMTPALAGWLEAWAESGSQSGGALALVFSGKVDPTGAAVKLTSTFKSAAQRLGMDFLQVAVPAFKEPQSASVPQLAVPPPNIERSRFQHWGLNE